MIKSMTGFAAAKAPLSDDELSIEIKAVNHKFCEVKVRVPREFSLLENELIKRVKERVWRGALDVVVRRHSTAPQQVVPEIDARLAKEYWKKFEELAAELGIEKGVTFRDVLSQPGVLRLIEPTVDMTGVQQAIHSSLSAALDGLEQMRVMEGAAISGDLSARLNRLEQWVEEIALISSQTVQEYSMRLGARITELLGTQQVDPQRLAQEVAFMAERADISEEMTRLRSHFVQFRNYLLGNDSVGRKLDFLVQEMHREVNTLGSKSQNREIANRVVELKAEIEKIREQVQNVE